MYYSGNADRPVHHLTLESNKVFGAGYHPIGIGSGFHAHDIDVAENYVQVLSAAPTTERWPPGPGDPPGQLHPANGIRFHKGPQRRVTYESNTVVAKASGVPEEQALARGLWLIPSPGTESAVFRRNRVKLVALNEHANGDAVAALGTDAADESAALLYENNTVLSNVSVVRFGDNYAHGGKHHFVDSTFVRLGNDPRYSTVSLGWRGWNFDTYGHTFLDTRFDGGAGFDSVEFDGAEGAKQDFRVLRRLTLLTDRSAQAKILDAVGSIVYEGTVQDGEMTLPLEQHTHSRSGRTARTPHVVSVTNPGHPEATQSVTMDRPKVLDMRSSAEESFRLYLPICDDG
jgi:hypothetical protein